jgi:hypothetical protein
MVCCQEPALVQFNQHFKTMHMCTQRVCFAGLFTCSLVQLWEDATCVRIVLTRHLSVLSQFYPSSYITVAYSVIEASIAVSQIIAAPVAAGLLQLSGVWGLAGEPSSSWYHNQQ